MFTDSRNSRFSFTEFVALVVIVGALLALTPPSIQASREASQENACSNKLKQLGLALHSHADAYKRFPPVSYCSVPGDTVYGGCPAFVNAGCMSATDPHVPNAAADISSGYSWIVRVLPFLDETVLYNKIIAASVKFTLAPWNPKVAIVDAAGRNVHPATTQLAALICPSFPGAPTNSQNAPYPQKTYAISNYVALAATNYHRMGLPPYANPMLEPNGIVTQNVKTGLRLSAMKDGTSKTLALSESREDNMAVWLDGAVNWGVAVAPDSTNTAPSLQPDGFLGYTANPYPADVKLSIAQTGNDRSAAKYYMSGGKVQGINDVWLWGPSSAHPGGVVMHLFADAAVRPFAPNIDINTYIRLVTRAGLEPIELTK